MTSVVEIRGMKSENGKKIIRETWVWEKYVATWNALVMFGSRV